MSPKNLYGFEAAVYTALTAAAVAVFFRPPIPNCDCGKIAIIAGCVLAAMAIKYWNKCAKMPANASFLIKSTKIKSSSLEQSRARFFKKTFFWLLSSPVLSYIIYSQFRDLESGKVHSITVNSTILLVYNTLGFWSAVMLFPMFAAIFTLYAFFRIVNLTLYIKGIANQTQPGQAAR